jgi:Glycosyltransferase
MKLTTGQFNDSFQPVMDGVANVTKNYAYWLNRKYGKSYVITPAYPQYIDTEEFEVLRYPSIAITKRPPYRLGMPSLNLTLMKYLNNIPFDIVHAHCPFTSGQIALTIAKKQEIPLVATFHSKYYDDFKVSLKNEQTARLMLKRTMSFFDSAYSVWTVNKASVETMRSYGYKGNVEVVYNGTDFIPPSNILTKVEMVNQRLNIPANQTVFLFVGQHILQKNVIMIIEALYHLKKLGVSYTMVFAGTGYAEEQMKETVKTMGLEDNVKFLGLITDREYLKALFCRADLFLFPSIYDNAPIVVREAAAVRCPSVVIEGSNSAEGITDCYNGFLARNDAMEFADKINTVISDKEMLEKVGYTAQRTLYSNWASIVDEVAKRYREIIKAYNRNLHVI